MLPLEVVQTLVDFGICYQVEVRDLEEEEILKTIGLHPPETDDEFSKIGYNTEKEEDGSKKEKIKLNVISDPKKLKSSNGWNIAVKPPKTLTVEDYPRMVISARITKRKLVILCDDIPWSQGVVKYIFSLEYIENIKFSAQLNTLIITTKFGQTGIKLA